MKSDFIDFWGQVIIRQQLIKDITGVDHWVDVCRRSQEGFMAKSNQKKSVKQLVSEIEMFRQLPNYMRKGFYI